MKKILFLSLLLFLTTLPAFAEDLVLKLRGKEIKRLEPEEISKIVAPADYKVYEPHEDKEIRYKGWELSKLFQSVYGSRWRAEEEILFTCADGYQPSLPLVTFANNKAILAFARTDGKAFEVDNRFQNEKKVPLGPYYLVWDSSKNADLKGAHLWPYQVVSLDLISFQDKFPGMAPPKKSSKSVQAGFLTYRTHCMSCHTINGEGGTKGVELNYPMNVTEYLQTSFLKKWILNPTSVRHGSTMPGYEGKLSPKAIGEIIDYLKAMKGRKIQPKS